MKLKIKQVDIPPADPFQNDVLNRKESAEILNQLISSLDEPSVIAIDAPWGFGKTTFLKMFRQDLINKEFKTLYFNAWENDFADDALATLIGEIELGIKELELGQGKKSKINKSLRQIKDAGSYLVKKSAPIVLSSVTGGVVNSDVLKMLTESIAKEQIENYEKAKKNLHNFRNKLTNFIKTISDNYHNPVVFFIDELDRCRPNFAIEILEKAKHLFSVPGFVFVIAIDKEQIGHSIRSIYGQEMDVDGYLRRFIDFDYILPQPENKAFAEYLFNQYEFNHYFAKRRAVDNRWAAETLTEMFAELSSIFNLSLRVQEQCFSLITIILRTIPYDYEIHAHLLIFLLLLKARNIKLYRRYISNIITAEELITEIKNMDNGKTLFKKHIGTVLEAYITAGRNDRQEINKTVNSYKKLLSDESVDESEKENAANLIEIINDIRSKRQFNIAKNLSQKIDISERFLE